MGDTSQLLPTQAFLLILLYSGRRGVNKKKKTQQPDKQNCQLRRRPEQVAAHRCETQAFMSSEVRHCGCPFVVLKPRVETQILFLFMCSLVNVLY